MSLKAEEIKLLVTDQSTTIIQAASKGQLGMIKCIKNLVGATTQEWLALLKIPDKIGSSALHKAAYSGHVEVIAYVLYSVPLNQRISLVAAQNQHGHTPIHCACYNNQSIALKLILESISKEQKFEILQLKKLNGYTAAHIAASNCFTETLKCILEVITLTERYELLQFPDEELANSAVHHAVYQGDSEAITIMRASVSILNWYTALKTQNKHGNTPIHIAILRNHTDVLKKLVSSFRSDDMVGKLLQIQDVKGFTPLHAAAIYGCNDSVKVLYNRTKAIDCWYQLTSIEDHIESTPIHKAAYSGRREILNFFLHTLTEEQWFTLLSKKNKYGNTPLHCAAYAGKIGTLQCLLGSVTSNQHYTLLEAQTDSGQTALHIATMNRHTEFVEALIKQQLSFDEKPKHCWWNFTNNEGYTAEDIAMRSTQHELAAYLKEHIPKIHCDKTDIHVCQLLQNKIERLEKECQRQSRELNRASQAEERRELKIARLEEANEQLHQDNWKYIQMIEQLEERNKHLEKKNQPSQLTAASNVASTESIVTPEFCLAAVSGLQAEQDELLASQRQLFCQLQDVNDSVNYLLSSGREPEEN